MGYNQGREHIHLLRFYHLDFLPNLHYRRHTKEAQTTFEKKKPMIYGVFDIPKHSLNSCSMCLSWLKHELKWLVYNKWDVRGGQWLNVIGL